MLKKQKVSYNYLCIYFLIFVFLFFFLFFFFLVLDFNVCFVLFVCVCVCFSDRLGQFENDLQLKSTEYTQLNEDLDRANRDFEKEQVN